ncbi:MAG: excisionase family DNA-binding protein, partial [Thermomicrobiales bacterium]
PKTPKPFMTKPEAARALGVSLWSIDRGVKSGRLPSVRIASRVLIPAAAVQALIAVGVASVQQTPTFLAGGSRRMK